MTKSSPFWVILGLACFSLFTISILAESEPSQTNNWAEWRGPSQNGHAELGQTPPQQWSEDENILWKTPIRGKGHSSPIIFEDRIILTTADDTAEEQLVICYDRITGEQKWETVVLEGNLPARIHKNNTHASPTAPTDGKYIYPVFYNGKHIYLTALDMTGKQVWQIKAGEYRSKLPFGYGASPALYKDLVIVASETEGDSFIAAFSKTDGKQQWRTPRKAKTSFSSPVVAHIDGKDQLLMSGHQQIASYDPTTGKRLWSTPADWPITCGTIIWSKDKIFASGGYPDKQTIAIKSDGSNKALWSNKSKTYEQSLLHVDGYIYTLNDTGICYCWDATTGKEMWKQRLRGPVSASPIYADGKIYATNEQGICFVFKADPSKYTELARNQIGELGFATPAFVDNKIYIRTAFHSQDRQEYLYCIGD